MDPRRRLPPVHALVDREEVLDRVPAMARPYRVALARDLLRECRTGVLRVPEVEDPGAWAARELADRIETLLVPGPGPVLNGTGVALHTNLGRAPLGPAVLQALSGAGAYSDLELDLGTGRRGNRNLGVSRLLALLCGAEAGLAVNNNAAAVLLAARALARGGEVLISRGELVEIGGSFRIPEVIESAGARLREVGTTNRTHLEDFRRAAGPETRMILKVHTSNFRVEGFTASPGRKDLSALARDLGVPLVEDLGSGNLRPLESLGLGPEPTPEAVLGEGVDLVTFSGDKLLGGVQAGLVAGRGDLVGCLGSDPLLRALRLDKLMTAGLQATLASYLVEGEVPDLPLHRYLARAPEELRGDCEWFREELARAIPELGLEVVRGDAPVGGGSCPGEQIEGYCLALEVPDQSPDRVARRLREARPPLVLRIEKERLLLDPRCFSRDERQQARDVLAEVLGKPRSE